MTQRIKAVAVRAARIRQVQMRIRSDARRLLEEMDALVLTLPEDTNTHAAATSITLNLRRLNSSTPSMPPPAPPAPPASPAPPSTNAQNGSNCRQVAIANVLRRKTITNSEVASYLRAFFTHQFSRELSIMSAADVSRAAAWTMAGVAHTALMTYALEDGLGDGFVAIYLGCADDVRRLGGEAFLRLALDDTETPGLIYFSHTHCMSMVKDAAGNWWDVPQSAAAKSDRARAASLLQLRGGNAGACCVLTPRAAATFASCLRSALPSSPAFLASAMPDALLVLRIHQRLGGAHRVISDGIFVEWMRRGNALTSHAFMDAETESLRRQVLAAIFCANT